MEEDSECAESGERKDEIKEIRAEDKVTETKKISKGGGQAKDASVNGVIVLEGRKHCKNCGNPLEE